MKISSVKSFRRAILPASIIAAMAMSGSASAFKIDSDNADVDIRWDNTFRYNAGWRAQAPTNYQTGSAFVGASETKYGSGDMVTNRLDVLSEFDFIYKKDTGFRVSGAAWYDGVYEGRAPQGGPGGVGAVYYPGGKYPDEVRRYYNGPSGEVLDAFVFTKFDLGDVPVNVKLGQHTIYWGETLFSLGDGISAGQSYADLRKALATPGVEAKEVFKPLNQFSFSAQVSPEFTVMGQYFFDHKIDLFPLGGTFYSPVDFLTYAGAVNTPLGFPWLGFDGKAKDKTGDWGLAAKWRPEWLDGTAGFYYREYTPKNSGALAINMGGGFAPIGAGIYLDPAAPRTKLTGFSLAKQMWGISFGTDITYRKDASLQTITFFPVNAGAVVPGVLGGASDWAPLGDIWTATLNMIAYDGKRDLFGLPLYDSAVFIAELDYDGVDKVTKNKSNWNSAQNCSLGTVADGKWAGTNIRANGGCVTGESYGINISFEPKWFQVFPGTDVTMPMFYGVGLKGNSSVPAVGQNEHQGAYSIGVTADVDAKYNFALKYNGFIYKHVSSTGNYVSNGCLAVGAPVAACTFPIGQGNSNAALGDFSHKSTITFTAKATW